MEFIKDRTRAWEGTTNLILFNTFIMCDKYLPANGPSPGYHLPLILDVVDGKRQLVILFTTRADMSAAELHKLVAYDQPVRLGTGTYPCDGSEQSHVQSTFHHVEDLLRVPSSMEGIWVSQLCRLYDKFRAADMIDTEPFDMKSRNVRWRLDWDEETENFCCTRSELLSPRASLAPTAMTGHGAWFSTPQVMNVFIFDVNGCAGASRRCFTRMECRLLIILTVLFFSSETVFLITQNFWARLPFYVYLLVMLGFSYY